MAKTDVELKAAKKAARAARKEASKARRKQLWQAFQIQRKEDKALIPLMAGAFVGVLAVFVVLGFVFDWLIVLIPSGIMFGGLAAFVIFGRRVQKSMYRKADGQLGAGAWALGNMRGQWRVQQAVAGNTHLDAVHRVIGRAGVIFVGEGNTLRVTSLINQEKKKAARVVGDAPIYTIIVGNEEGQVPLSKLERHLSKLPNNITAKQMDALEQRLTAISARVAGPGMPKGPMPQGAKVRNMQRAAKRRS